MRFLARRLAHGVFVLLAVSAATFAFADWAPGDFLSEMRLDPRLRTDAQESLRQQWGLDDPLAVRYGRWLMSVAHGDFGVSFAQRRPVAEMLRPRLAATLLLGTTATLGAWLLALGLGTAAALRPGGRVDRGTAGLEATVLALPEVLLAVFGLLLASRVAWLPMGGLASLDREQMGPVATTIDIARHLLLPSLVLALAALPALTRHVRAAVRAALATPWLRAARGHGIDDRRLLACYVLPAAANPLLSLAGFSFGALLSGSLVVEVVFSWPGLGPLLLTAIGDRDLHVVATSLVVSAGFLVIGNLFADLALRAHDPRLRAESPASDEVAE